MTNAAQRNSVILPVLLAVIGVASLATAVMLVPVIIRTSLTQVQMMVPRQPAAPEPALSAPGFQAPADEAARAQPAAQPDSASAPETAIDDAPTAAEIGSWTLVLDPKSYALDDASSTGLDQIVSYLGSHPKTKLALTGVNNPMRSSKRAMQAARRVKETLIESGVERYRVSMTGMQEDGARGLVVRAEIAQDAR